MDLFAEQEASEVELDDWLKLFQSRFNSILSSLDQSKEGLNKMSTALSEIRSISGIDGHEIKAFTLAELKEK